MHEEERKYQEFMLELTKKTKELNESYFKLSDNNKRKFQANVKPILDAGAFAWLLGNKK